MAALVLLLALAGCVRVGSGDDLHLVCEEKSASPRKAYGIEFLVAETTVDDGVPADHRVALLEAARAHVVTPAGRAHAGFEAGLQTLRPVEGGSGESWRFRAIGAWEDQPPDAYVVLLRLEDGRAVASAEAPNPGPVAAPRTLADAAWRAVNATPELSAQLGEKPYVEWAAWDPALPSCVRLRVVDVGGAVEAVANIVQGRVVHIGP